MNFSVIKKKLKIIIKIDINSFRRLSIYKRLVLSFLIIILIPNLIISYYSFNISSREMDKNISSSTRQVLRDVASSINGKLVLYESLAAKINSNNRIRNLLEECRKINSSQYINKEMKIKYDENKKEIGNILYQTASSSDISNLEIVSEYDEFTQIDYAGKIAGASLNETAAYRKTENYLKAINADGSPIWADTSKDVGVFRYEDSKVSNIANYITLLKCIPDVGHNNPLGMIVINIPINVFNGIADLQNMYAENEVLFLAGKKGIISILNKTYIVKRMPDKEILNEISLKKSGNITRKISNSEVIVVFDTFSKMDMSIIYTVEREQIFRGIYLVRNIIIEITFICILCAALLSYFVTASISVPLKKLKNTMEKVGENGLELEYKDNYKDEIGVLGYRFNIMLLRIRNLLDNLINEELLRKNEEIRRKEAELDALQMQIKPHFLYNTLDLIRCNAMLEENGEGKISKMIASFSNLLRFNTIKTDKLVDINEEIDHIYAYINVLKLIKKKELSVELYLEDPAICYNKITKFTFQPIVENAIKHGLLGMDSKGVIYIHAFMSEGNIYIEIRDNGKGISEEQCNYLNSGLENGDLPGKSIGLKNVNERIKLFFGENFGLKIVSEVGKYTSVIIHIPIE